MANASDIGDAALEKATGRSWDGWRGIMEAMGAGDLPHKEIAQRLYDEHGAPGWWCQNITARFEQETGRRVPGQTCTGDFQLGVTAARRGSLDDTLALWRAKADGREEFDGVGLTAPASVSATEKWRYWRAPLADGSRLSVNICAKGEGKAMVQINHSKLADSDAVERWRGYWKSFLAEV